MAWQFQLGAALGSGEARGVDKGWGEVFEEGYAAGDAAGAAVVGRGETAGRVTRTRVSAMASSTSRTPRQAAKMLLLLPGGEEGAPSCSSSTSMGPVSSVMSDLSACRCQGDSGQTWRLPANAEGHAVWGNKDGGRDVEVLP